MAQTPTGSATPYASAGDLFAFHDWQQVADLLRDGDGPRPTKLAMLDTASTPGALLLRLLLSASGRVESQGLVGKRYQPADLAALKAAGGSGAERLVKLVADLAYYQLAERRQPALADPAKVPGARAAADDLKALGAGELVFGLVESAAAGLPSTSTPDPLATRPDGILSQGGRFFGSGGGRRGC